MSAEKRAGDLLLETEFFDELGLGRLAAASRMVARDVLELVEMLAAERSARLAIQARAGRLEEILLRDRRAGMGAECVA